MVLSEANDDPTATAEESKLLANSSAHSRQACFWNNINFYHAQEIIIIIVPFAGIPVAAHVFSVGQGGRSSCLGEDFWHCGLLDDILDRFDVAPVAAFVCFGKRQRKRLFSRFFPGYLQWFLRYHNLAIYIHLFNLIIWMEIYIASKTASKNAA